MFLVANGIKMKSSGNNDLNFELHQIFFSDRENNSGSLWSIHSNWIVGSDKKVDTMKKFDHFRLDELNNECR